jgi:hypothetical protein
MKEIEEFLLQLKHARYLEVSKNPRNREYSIRNLTHWCERYERGGECSIEHPAVTCVTLGCGVGTRGVVSFYFNRHGDLITHGISEYEKQPA